MTRQYHHLCVPAGLGLWLSALAVVVPSSAAHAQSAELVLCDRIAADPTDPDKPADVRGTADIAANDVATAIKFCKLASGKSRRALYQLGRAYAADRQWPAAIATYRKAISKGSSAAMVELGVMLAMGTGGPKDEAEARKLLERAAQAGNPRGATNLAALSERTGAPSDPGKTRAALEKGAEANSAEAQYQLGLMMAQGVGGPRDDVAARGLFEKAAAQDHPGALERMGAFAQSGRGGPRDLNAAKAYYQKAGALGNEHAKAELKRLQCPHVIKDKRGKVVMNLCF